MVKHKTFLTINIKTNHDLAQPIIIGAWMTLKLTLLKVSFRKVKTKSQKEFFK
jgi:hypothetical protein